MIHHCLKSKTVWMPLVFLFAFSLLMLYVFAPVLPLHTVTLSPDYAKFFKPSWFVTWSENLLSGTDPWCPSMLLNFCGHPLWRHTFFFVITSLFAALGVRYYLKTQHLSPLAAWSAGLCSPSSVIRSPSSTRATRVTSTSSAAGFSPSV